MIADRAISDAVPDARVEFGYSETQAPICFGNIVLIGASGSDYGVRGFVMAYKTDLTPAWSSPYWTIPPEGVDWREGGRYIGGGTNWNPVTVDATTQTVYATTSNPSPIFAPQVRPGPNPRTDAIVALDLQTGRQKWWQQQIAGDQWGYSTTQPVLLYDVKIGGRTRTRRVGRHQGGRLVHVRREDRRADLPARQAAEPHRASEARARSARSSSIPRPSAG